MRVRVASSANQYCTEFAIVSKLAIFEVSIDQALQNLESQVLALAEVSPTVLVCATRLYVRMQDGCRAVNMFVSDCDQGKTRAKKARDINSAIQQLHVHWYMSNIMHDQRENAEQEAREGQRNEKGRSEQTGKGKMEKGRPGCEGKELDPAISHQPSALQPSAMLGRVCKTL